MVSEEVSLLGDRVREMLCDLPPRGGSVLAGTPATNFLRGDLEGDEELVYRDGVVARLRKCPLKRLEEIVEHLRPTDYARDVSSGEAAFVWVADGSEKFFEYSEVRWRHLPTE
jgi:hypothetical protein